MMHASIVLGTYSRHLRRVLLATSFDSPNIHVADLKKERMPGLALSFFPRLPTTQSNY